MENKYFCHLLCNEDIGLNIIKENRKHIRWLPRVGQPLEALKMPRE